MMSLDLCHGAARRLPHRDRAVAVLDPVALEDLEALLLPGAGDAEDRDRLARVLAQLQAGLDHAAGDDVDPGVGDDRHHHRDLLDAVLLQDLLGEAAGLGDRGVAADLGVVGRLAALAADRVGQGQRAAAGADHQPQVALEAVVLALDHAAVVGGVDRRDVALEGRGLIRLPGVVLGDLQRLAQQLLLAADRLVLHLHVGVEGDEAAVGQLGQGVDLGEGHVVIAEEAGEAGEDRRRAVELGARHPGRGDRLLGLEVGDRQQVGEVPASDVVGMARGDLLDVDAAHVAEQHQRALRGPVPDDPGVVLLLDLGLGIDQHPARHVAVDLQLQDRLGVLGGLLRRVGELDAAGLHPPPAQHLRLDHHRPADLLGDLAGLVGARAEAVPGDRDSGQLDDLSCLVLEEAHQRRGTLSKGSHARGEGTPRPGILPPWDPSKKGGI